MTSYWSRSKPSTQGVELGESPQELDCCWLLQAFFHCFTSLNKLKAKFRSQWLLQLRLRFALNITDQLLQINICRSTDQQINRSTDQQINRSTYGFLLNSKAIKSQFLQLWQSLANDSLSNIETTFKFSYYIDKLKVKRSMTDWDFSATQASESGWMTGGGGTKVEAMAYEESGEIGRKIKPCTRDSIFDVTWWLIKL